MLHRICVTNLVIAHWLRAKLCACNAERMGGLDVDRDSCLASPNFGTLASCRRVQCGVFGHLVVTTVKDDLHEVSMHVSRMLCICLPGGLRGTYCRACTG